MPEFVYKAVAPSGKIQRGVLKAASEKELEEHLAGEGEILLEVRSNKEMKRRRSVRSIKVQDVIELTNQMVMLFNSGVPLVTGLYDLAEETTNPELKRVVEHIHQMVTEGTPLSEALATYPTIFSSSYVNVVVSGQETGNLAPSLDRLAHSMEWQHETKRSLRSAFTYPAILLTAVAGLIALLVTFLIPRLADVFVKAGVELPGPTKAALALSAFVVTWWPLIIGSIAAVIVSFIVARRTEKGAYAIDAMALRIPYLGRLVTLVEASNFASLFGVLLDSGVHSVRALEISRDAAANRVVKASIGNIHKSVIAGEPISGALRESRIFPNLVLRMVAIGEQSGMMVDALNKVSEFYDKEVPRSVKKFMAFLEPAITIATGVIVAGAVLSAFLPMVKMFSAMRGS